MSKALPDMRPALGIDLGGTKTLGIVLTAAGDEIARRTAATPRQDYAATLDVLAEMIATLENDAAPDTRPSIGIGMPGSISPVTGRVQNANSTWLNGRLFQRDLEERLSRRIKLANDADCFALSEAHDGAGQGFETVFGVIVGTGVGGGLVNGGKLISGPNRACGEWGHTPLPWAEPHEHPGPACWCGRNGCLESWLSGPALTADHQAQTGEALPAEEIAARAQGGSAPAQASLERHIGRLARGLAMVVNIIDPDVIVLGGGLSAMPHLATGLPRLMAEFVFADAPQITISPARHGPASGVRGAARLWQH